MEKDLIKLTLCTQGSCCPEVEISNNSVKIKDDFGGEVKISRAEAEMLADKLVSLRGEG